MKPSTERRLLSGGCLAVLIGVCFFGYLTLSSHWAYAVVVAGLVGGWLLIKRVESKHDHRRHLALLEVAFASSGHPLPRFEEGSSYAFRTFRLIFPSEAELRLADESGCIAAFKEGIQSLYEDTGSKQNPFDADRAVWATYEGWQARFTEL